MSVLVNESPTVEFSAQTGIRQGDPLAPFLFILVAEGLGGMMREATRKDLFEEVSICDIGVSILQFSDDTLFLGKPTVRNILTLKSILRSFELVEGLNVNFHKIKIGGVALESQHLQSLVAILNCRIMEVPFTF